MGLFDFLRRTDINAQLDVCRDTAGACLLDVRTPEEFAEGRIPGSRNLPLDELMRRVSGEIPALETPLFVYCYSGSRSAAAVAALKRMGYQHVTNIGGICDYRGKMEG